MTSDDPPIYLVPCILHCYNLLLTTIIEISEIASWSLFPFCPPTPLTTTHRVAIQRSGTVDGNRMLDTSNLTTLP